MNGKLVISWCQQAKRGWEPVWLAFTLICCGALAAAGQEIESLRIGLQTYEHVEIQSKTATHLFFKHDKGFASVKLQEIPLMVQQKLGLAPGGGPAPSGAKGGAAQASATSQSDSTASPLGSDAGGNNNGAEKSALIPPQLLEQAQTMLKPYQEKFQAEILPVIMKVLWLVILLAVICHLFFSFCFMLVCQKAGQPGSFLVWLPLLQLIPLFKAAKMSGWCLLLCFIPVVNLILMVVWCFKICTALKKPAVLGLFLLLPVASLFVLLYLAFSEGGSEEEDGGVVKLDFVPSTQE